MLIFVICYNLFTDYSWEKRPNQYERRIWKTTDWILYKCLHIVEPLQKNSLKQILKKINFSSVNIFMRSIQEYW